MVRLVQALKSFRAILKEAGYPDSLVRDGKSANAEWITGYGAHPPSPRNACVTAVASAEELVLQEVLKETGASLGLALDDEAAEATVWKASAGGPRRAMSLGFHELKKQARTLLDPRAIHRAKTLGRFDGSYQLELVDSGLLPRIEQAQGEQLQRLLERIVAELRAGRQALSPEQGHQLLTIAFWVLAARLLQDHDVPSFRELTGEWKSVLQTVARHYGGAIPALAGSKDWQARISAATKVAWNFGVTFRGIGPEAISYVYESSLVAEQVRRDLGTHSTPPYLVDYVLGRLQPHILAIPHERRQVVEPACGHAAFLVAALRILAEDAPDDASRHEYLRARIRGIEIDHAAKEMARLSLTIADLPNPDGWDLREGDMFENRSLEKLVREGTVFLANAPFEDFPTERRRQLAKVGLAPLPNQSAEMLRRALPLLARDAVFGVVIPRQILNGASERELRKMILSRFELLEICVLPDGVFQHADHECAIILARGCTAGTQRATRVLYRRVREKGLRDFRQIAVVSDEETVPGAMFLDDPETSFVVPELRRLWLARAWPTLGTVARAQQGLSHHTGVEGIRSRAFNGSAAGLADPGQSGNVTIFDPLPKVYIDLNPEHVMRFRGGRPTGQPQLILNYHPHSRGPWRLKAHIDPTGAAISSARISLRPLSADVSLEVLWAICNSPIANAFVYSHMLKRNTSVKTFERLPIPRLSRPFRQAVTQLVQRIFRAEKDRGPMMECLDAIVLSAYGLFGPGEQRLRALFDGHQRIGVPFDMTSIGGHASRLPLYINLPKVTPYLPTPDIGTRLAFVGDFDAEIDDGRHELAELRRRSREDERIPGRADYVRAMLSRLEHEAADRWIPEETHHGS